MAEEAVHPSLPVIFDRVQRPTPSLRIGHPDGEMTSCRVWHAL